MAANAEATLEQILTKLSQIAEKIGEKTTAKERQEENLKKYSERKEKSTPDDITKQVSSIASDVADVAKAANRHWIPTLDGNESKRIENIAKIYGKALKLTDNFTSIKQLLKNTEADKAASRFKLRLPSFDIGSMFDTKWFSKSTENTRRTNWSKKFQSINNMVTDSISNIFKNADWDWFEKNTKNTRRFNWSKKFESANNFFSVGDKIKDIQWFKDVDWNWFDKNIENTRRFSWSKRFEPVKNFFNIGDKIKDIQWFKDVDWNWFDTNTKNTRRFDWSKKFEPVKNFFNIGDKIKDIQWFKDVDWSWFDKNIENTRRFNWFKDVDWNWFEKNTENTRRNNWGKQLKAKITQFNDNVKGIFTSAASRVEQLASDTKKSIRESRFVTELKKYKDRLKDLKSGTSTYLNNLASQLSTGVEDLKKNAGSFVDKLQQNVLLKYTAFKESVSKMLPTFKKKPAEDGKSADKAAEKTSFVDKFKKSSVAIAALGAGVALLVGAMVKCGVVDAKSVGVFAGLVAVLGAAVWGLSSKSDEISKGAKAIGILGATFGLVVLALKGLVGMKWDEIKEGVMASGIVIAGLAGIALIIGKLASKNVVAAVAGSAALLGLTMLVGMLGENLGKFADYDWKTIDANLGVATAAIIGLSLLAGAIGGLIAATGGTGAIVAAVGLASIAALAKTMGYTGEQLKVYNDINGDQLGSVGEGLKTLGAGIASFFAAIGITGAVGVVGGAIQSAAKWFDLDLVSQVKRYEQIDGSKIDVLGKSLTSLANGFKDFSSISKDSKQFSTGLSEIKDLEKLDVKKISTNLDSIAAKLSNIRDVSSQLGENTSKFKFEISGVSEMSQAITQLGAQEIDLLQQQLMILNDSRDLLSMISQNTTGMSRGSASAPNQEGSLSMIRENSTTRQSFFNNLKMMSTTLKD